MAGSVLHLDTASLITGDRQVNIGGSGSHRSVTFLLDLTAITKTTGTLTLSLYWKTPVTGASVLLARGTDLDLVKTYLITPTANVFSLTRQSIPAPNVVLWEPQGDATLISGSVYAIYGD